jgi:aldehyde dehydrogenase (NAD+)
MNPFQALFDRQQSHFATGVTRSREWRIEQLDRMGRLIVENEAALQQAIGRDFKTTLSSSPAAPARARLWRGLLRRT